jgi:hypothetical protein
MPNASFARDHERQPALPMLPLVLENKRGRELVGICKG